ncbi:DNA translocase FtsK 4TM domain-containing protein [Candidatus Epulonipiscium viviparus]|uniref:DNA translocase FtsK 4TM domain-containing protein n=1 Tax=Candidatus Epulonipiscium viviparus TaxID=420336 RepID=UPI002738082A|nr:DNA translocase FtsK 4TM domain-containing protein [Candidatus Epulopiscium viviparus]
MKKRKRKKKVNQAPEVVGISIIGCCVLIIASIFTEQAGMIGNAIKYVTVGMFGLGGYMLPFYILYLGFTYIRNGKKCIENKISKAWPIFIMIVFGAELLSKDMPEILSVYLTTYFADTTFINGGLIGSIVVNVLVKFLGLYGTYIVILGSAFLYVFKLYNFSFVAWIKAIPSLEPKQPKRRQRRSVSSVKVAYREPAPAARATRKVHIKNQLQRQGRREKLHIRNQLQRQGRREKLRIKNRLQRQGRREKLRIKNQLQRQGRREKLRIRTSSSGKGDEKSCISRTSSSGKGDEKSCVSRTSSSGKSDEKSCISRTSSSGKSDEKSCVSGTSSGGTCSKKKSRQYMLQ